MHLIRTFLFTLSAWLMLLVSAPSGAQVYLHDDLAPGFTVVEPRYTAGLVEGLYRSRRSYPIIIVNGRLRDADASPRAGAYIRHTSEGDPVCLIAIDPQWAAALRAKLNWPGFDRFAMDHEIHHCSAFYDAGLRSDPPSTSATLSAELGADIFAMTRAVAAHQWSTVDKIIELRRSMADGAAHDTGEILSGIAGHLTAADLDGKDDVALVEFANHLRDLILPGIQRVGCLQDAGADRVALQYVERDMASQLASIHRLEEAIRSSDEGLTERLSLHRQQYERSEVEAARLRYRIADCYMAIRSESINYRNLVAQAVR